MAALSQNNILLPSACGGKGSCGVCKCKVAEGGRDILPTELAHLSRSEKLDNIRLSCQLKVKEDMRIRIPDEIFNIKKYDATVVSNDNVASFIKELRLRLDPGQKMDFETGCLRSDRHSRIRAILPRDPRRRNLQEGLGPLRLLGSEVAQRGAGFPGLFHGQLPRPKTNCALPSGLPRRRPAPTEIPPAWHPPICSP